jgi:hypothetical protein
VNFHQLAKVQWAFANSQKFNELLLFLTEEYECIVDSHQLAKVQGTLTNWRKYKGLSPIGESTRDSHQLAKVQGTLANWRKS